MTDFLSPSEYGFAMPPEWSRQEGVFLSWPHNPATWPATMPEIRKMFAKYAAVISRYEKVYILRGNAPEETILEELCEANATISNVRLFDIRTNDVWCRDHGPVFVRNASTGERAIVDFSYNAWGGKFPPWDADDAVPGRIAEVLKMRRFTIPIVCEGGALEINSLGDLMTTETVLLNPNRNPGIGKEEMGTILKAALGAKNILWLKQGLAGDDTDGHIDTLARFVSEDVVLAPSAPAWNPNLRSKTAIRTSESRYFSDPSIGVASLGIGPNDLISDLQTMGLLFETLCVRDLRAYADALDGMVYHYRDKSGLECDAVVHLRNGKYGLVEIKLGGDMNIEAGAKTLKTLAEKIDTDKMRVPSFLMVLTGTAPYAYRRKDEVWVVPVGCLKD